MKKLFTNDRFFLAMVLLSILGEGICSFMFFAVFKQISLSKMILLLRLACIFVLYCSYKKHNKNVMKGMMGALLMAQLITAITLISEVTIPSAYWSASLFLLLTLFLFINHFIINSNRRPSPCMIFINQLLVCLMAVNNTVLVFSWIVQSRNLLITLCGILDIVGFIGITSVVVCVESRLDAYRLDREAAGWTEEKGYPRGYVHEYQKNK